MPTYRAQFITHGTNGTSKDTYVNTFHLFHQTASITDLAPDNSPWSEAIGSVLYDFYNTPGSTTERLCDYMSPRFSGASYTIKYYDHADPPNTGAKAIVIGAHGGGPAVQGMPEEVAVCLSYKALNSGFNIARRRGRIYLGPLNIAAIDDIIDHSQPCAVRPSFMDCILERGAALKGSLLGAGWHWRVFSQMDGFGFDIVQFSVDNAFDTIRGRGTAPSMRISN